MLEHGSTKPQHTPLITLSLLIPIWKPFMAVMAACALPGLSKLTNPKHLLWLVARSINTCSSGSVLQLGAFIQESYRLCCMALAELLKLEPGCLLSTAAVSLCHLRTDNIAKW